MPILFGLTLIIIVFIQFSKSREKNVKKNSEEFWQKERQSRFVPKKDISSLDYISVPYGSLPFCCWMPGSGGPVRMTKGTMPASKKSEWNDGGGEVSLISHDIPDKASIDTLLAEVSSTDNDTSANSYVRAAEHTAPLSEELADVEFELCTLADSRILNLTGISNTELRLTYGTANLDPLTSYDHNFTVLIRALQKWGTLLASAGKTRDAVTVLSYAVSIGSDIAGTYALLARLYQKQGELQKIKELKTCAESLSTLMKPSILRDLEQVLAQTP